MKNVYITAALIAGISAFSMSYMYNNMSGTNNAIATYSAAITALSYIALKKFKVI